MWEGEKHYFNGQITQERTELDTLFTNFGHSTYNARADIVVNVMHFRCMTDKKPTL